MKDKKYYENSSRTENVNSISELILSYYWKIPQAHLNRKRQKPLLN